MSNNKRKHLVEINNKTKIAIKFKAQFYQQSLSFPENIACGVLDFIVFF